MLIGVLLDRPAITLRAVATAAILLLVFRPESLTQVGFQMSFAATTALVASFEFLKHQSHWQSLQFGRGRFVQPIAALIISSFIAGAATAPFAAFHFNQFSQYGLIANLVSVPVMGLLVMPAAVLAGLLSPFGLEGGFFWVMGQGINWILGAAHWVAGFEGAVRAVPKGIDIVLPMIAFGGVFFIIWRGTLRWCGPILCLIAFGAWVMSERPDVLISDTGRLLGVIHNNQRALNRKRGNGFAARVWLENDGDKVEQGIAATRWDDFSDIMVMNIGAAKLGYIWPMKTEQKQIKEYCRKSDILIAPNAEDIVDAPCLHVSKKYLRRNGSVAITYTNNALQIKTARGVSGARLWNSWWLRKKP